MTRTDDVVLELSGQRRFAICVEVADTHYARAKGLLGRCGLVAGRGLWITPCSGVHTFFMRFPIDVIGLDAEHRVEKIWPNLKPWRLTRVRWKVRSVVELAAGAARVHGIEVGDVLEMQGAV